MIKIFEAENDTITKIVNNLKSIARGKNKYLTKDNLAVENLYDIDYDSDYEDEMMKRNSEIEKILSSNKYYAVIYDNQYVEFITSDYADDAISSLSIKDGINIFKAPYGYIVRAYYNGKTSDLIFVVLNQDEYGLMKYWRSE